MKEQLEFDMALRENLGLLMVVVVRTYNKEGMIINTKVLKCNTIYYN